MQSNANVLQVENIITRFNTQDGKVFAVNGISFDLKEGELLGVVGESGSGKSVTMMSLLKLLPMPPAEIVEGRALFENQDLIQMDLNQLRKIRGGKIGFIFQDPMTSLNPVLTVGYQLMEPMREHLGLSREEARNKAIELLELVGIPIAQSRLKDFPHQFSGGMRQRVMIAIALACDPKVLIADEPTTALDVTIQAQKRNKWGGNNMPRWCSAEYDALSAEMAKTANLEDRIRLAKQMNDMLMQDYAMIPLIHRGDVSAHSSSISGVRMNSWDSELWNIADWKRN